MPNSPDPPGRQRSRHAREGASGAIDASLASLDGDRLRRMFAEATSFLRANADAINAINVFPVPDGDTGTNMYLTMRAAVEEAARLDGASAGEVAQAMARGALMGARGNSGVILSQILRGLARLSADLPHFTSADIAAGLDAGCTAAYEAVSRPVEGTILTVVRRAAEAARVRAAETPDLEEALAAAVAAARQAVDETPLLLPVLKEAGVVDAGGQGFYVLLDGALRSLRGEPPPLTAARPGTQIEPSWLAATEVLHDHDESERFGYCTEFVLDGGHISRQELRERMLALGESVLVVGDDGLLRVHLHTRDPGAALTIATSLGAVSHVKVENMEAQLHQFVERHRTPATPELPPGRVSLVAIASGRGLAEALRDVGVHAVVPGGQTMNPSTRDIVDAIEDCPTDEVIVLPNNKNVVLTARQAAQQSSKRVAVVPTHSVPQGIAAALALDRDAPLEENLPRLEEAAAAVRWAEITLAARSTVVQGRPVEQGQPIGIVDGDLTVVEATLEDTVRACLRRLLGPGATLVTLYHGHDISSETAQALGEQLTREFGVEVEVVPGNQPHYPYILSVE